MKKTTPAASSTAQSKSVVSTLRRKVKDVGVMDIEAVGLRKVVLNGGFMTQKSNKWRSPQWKMLVYLSSAYTDCKIEREILSRTFLQALRKRASIHGISFDILDLRLGLRDDNVLDEKAWVERKIELERCQRDSAGVFFISFQSEK